MVGSVWLGWAEGLVGDDGRLDGRDVGWTVGWTVGRTVGAVAEGEVDTAAAEVVAGAGDPVVGDAVGWPP